MALRLAIPAGSARTALQPQPAAYIRECLRAHIAVAAAALRGARTPSDEAIHTARKQIKRARALLRLLRDCVCRRARRRENVALRDAGRRLSRVRDALVLQQALRRVRGKDSRTRLGELEAALRLERLQARRRLLTHERRARLRSELLAAEGRVAAWTLSAGSLRGPLRLQYRKGKQALARAQVAPMPDLLHEARKQVQIMELALEPFERAAPSKRLARLIAEIEAIEERLGRSHDLTVLLAWIEPRLRSEGKHGAALIARLERKRTRLDRSALRAASRCYARPWRAFSRSIEPALAENVSGAASLLRGHGRSSTRAHRLRHAANPTDAGTQHP